MAQAEKIPVIEKGFALTELYEADEAFNSSSNAPVTPIVQADDRKIKDGIPGPISKHLYESYMKFVAQGVSRG